MRRIQPAEYIACEEWKLDEFFAVRPTLPRLIHGQERLYPLGLRHHHHGLFATRLDANSEPLFSPIAAKAISVLVDCRSILAQATALSIPLGYRPHVSSALQTQLNSHS